MYQSPLKWPGKKAELYEILIPLDNLGIITENGYKHLFPSIVWEFSRTVGLPYDTNCHNEQHRILLRNVRKSVFIDRLKRRNSEMMNFPNLWFIFDLIL